MHITDKIFPAPALSYPLTETAPLRDFLFLDIETTGLSAEKNAVILIGCAGFTAEGTLGFRQFFAESREEEPAVIHAFLDYTADRKILVTYNGDRFDLRFLKKRAVANGIEGNLDGLLSFDLYQCVHPVQNLLGLVDGRQQTVEAFLGTGRTEDSDGRDTVLAYDDYLRDRAPEKRNFILTHNEADVLGLLKLLPLLSYRDFFHRPPQVTRAQANYYDAYDGIRQQELLIYFHPATPLPKPILGSREGCLLKADGNEGLVKVPLYEEEMKYFYADYRNYWYFPAEDEAVHKSIAVYADKTHRVPATAETCYTRKKSSFLPMWSAFCTPFFRRSYDDPALFFELTPERKKDRALFVRYAQYVCGHILK